MKITPFQAKKMMSENPSLQIIDVREGEEYDTGHIPEALLLPLNQLNQIYKIIPNFTTPILLYCQSGTRSLKAAQLLRNLGYQNVYDFGGIDDWPYEQSYD